MLDRAEQQGLVGPDSKIHLHMIHLLACPARAAERDQPGGTLTAACTCDPTIYLLGDNRQTYWWDAPFDQWSQSPEAYPGKRPDVLG